MEVFSNREIAIGIWIVIATMIAIMILTFGKSIRQSFKSILSALFCKAFLIIYTLIILYTIGCVELLRLLEVWDNSQIKNVIIWLITVGLVQFFRMGKIDKDPKYFYHSFVDNFKILVTLQFVTWVYSFSLFVELMLVPSLFLLSAIQVYTNFKEEHRLLNKVVGRIIELIGSVIIIFTMYKLCTQFYEFASVKTLLDLIVPTYLSIMILPFYYLLSLYMKYEVVLSQISDQSLKGYFLFRMIRYIGFRKKPIDLLLFYKHSKGMNNRNDVDLLVRELKEQLKREKYPPTIPLSEGWSPYIVKDLLNDKGFITDSYKELEGEWFSHSNRIKLGNDSSLNDISYYIDGDASVANKLQLVMMVYYKNNMEGNGIRLLEFADVLCSRSLNMDLSAEIRCALILEQPCSIETEYAKIEVLRNEFPGKLGYSLKFCICHSSLN